MILRMLDPVPLYIKFLGPGTRKHYAGMDKVCIIMKIGPTSSG